MCGDRDLAADLTQETYRKAWEALAGFDGRSQFFTWLYRIAYTTFLNAIRRPRRLTSLDAPDAPEMRDDAPSVDQLLSNEEDAERLRAAVLQLPEDLRFTVTAHFWGGLAVKEIARIENVMQFEKFKAEVNDQLSKFPSLTEILSRLSGRHPSE